MKVVLTLMVVGLLTAACAKPRDDGMGNLWKGYKHVIDQRK